MPGDTPFELVAMEPWMLPGMAELQAGQYKVDPAKAEARLRTWFDSEFAHRRGSIALAGISGDRVIAMQTYSAWPYVRNGRSYRSLQSGATLVHPDFRGRKIFQRLLREGNRLATANGHDFLVGFPVPMSLGGFVKDGWTNHGPLRWWTRPLRPLALLQRKAPTSTLELPRCPGDNFCTESVAPTEGRGGMFSLTDELDFLQWRYSHRAEDFRCFRHSRSPHHPKAVHSAWFQGNSNRQGPEPERLIRIRGTGSPEACLDGVPQRRGGHLHSPAKSTANHFGGTDLGRLPTGESHRTVDCKAVARNARRY